MQAMKEQVVQGTILILDGSANNRIMLRVQLTAAWYDVVQGASIGELPGLIDRYQPDAIVTAMTLPDGSALDIPAVLAGTSGFPASLPVIAIAADNDHAARLRALEAGVDDVLIQPVTDALLLSRLRNLIRSRSAAEELSRQDATGLAAGLAESASAFALSAGPLRAALITYDAATAASWRIRPDGQRWQNAHSIRFVGARSALADKRFQAVVVELDASRTAAEIEQSLQLVTDLQMHSNTRDAVIVGVSGKGSEHLAAQALDRGAHDVLSQGFCDRELALRLANLLDRKAWTDGVRGGIRAGLRAAVTDPMTGLHNRRYAMPRLDAIAAQAADHGRGFAVMLADLDHFKQVNDRFGHQAGDTVLVECARRLRGELGPSDLIARVGGEEFLIVLPEADRERAMVMADRLRKSVDHRPFDLADGARAVSVTISVGVAVIPPGNDARSPGKTRTAGRLMALADEALYSAKDAGRNRIIMTPAAA